MKWVQKHLDLRWLVPGLLLSGLLLVVGYEADRRSCERSAPVRAFEQRVAQRLSMQGAPGLLDCSTIPPGH